MADTYESWVPPAGWIDPRAALAGQTPAGWVANPFGGGGTVSPQFAASARYMFPQAQQQQQPLEDPVSQAAVGGGSAVSRPFGGGGPRAGGGGRGGVAPMDLIRALQAMQARTPQVGLVPNAQLALAQRNKMPGTMIEALRPQMQGSPFAGLPWERLLGGGGKGRQIPGAPQYTGSMPTQAVAMPTAAAGPRPPHGGGYGGGGGMKNTGIVPPNTGMPSAVGNPSMATGNGGWSW